jgi:hypothetical protein
MDTWQVIALGCAGGALPDVLRVIERRYEPAPDYLKRPFFWVSFGLLVCLGGIAAVFLSTTRLVDALAIGFSAPSLISGLLGQKAPAPRQPTPSELKQLGQEIDLMQFRVNREKPLSDVSPEKIKPLEPRRPTPRKPADTAGAEWKMWRMDHYHSERRIAPAPSLIRAVRQWWGGGDLR